MTGWVYLEDEDIVLGERYHDTANFPRLRMRRLDDGSVQMTGLMQGRRIMVRLPEGYRPDRDQLPPTKRELLNPRFDERGDLVGSDGTQFTSFFSLGLDVYMVVWVEI